MKTLRVTMQFCFALCLLLLVASGASASTLTLTGNLYFPSLDGSSQDSDGLANGTFTVAEDLVLDGTIHCNDAPPLPASAGACEIRIKVAGDLILEPGSGIFSENRRGTGNGSHIELEVGGDLTLRGPDGSLAGAIVSTSQTVGGGGTAGNLTAEVSGAVDLEIGSVLAASSSGTAGAIAVTGDTVRVAGLIASGHSRTVLPSFLTGEVLAGSSSSQAGGTILLKALGAAEPGLRIEPEGIVVSEGRLRGGRLVLLEGCGIEVSGLVASVSRNNGPSQVVLRSGKGILVDGRDLGIPDAPESRFGRIRADSTQQGAANYLVDLFAESHIQVLGPDSAGSAPFAVSSTPGDWSLRNAGGFISVISLSGSLTATGRAFETGRNGDGDKGGGVDLQAKGEVMLDGATVWAVGGHSFNSNAAVGGQIDVRSFQGAVSWTFGVGDVRPTGTGVPLARRGTIEITACTTVDITGTQFPVNGNPVPPFPVETEGVCSPTAPSLPDGEPPLPVCAPANQPPAPSGGPFTIAENSPNGTVVGTVSANDPDAGQSHTFSITAGNTDGAFAIDSAGQITVANSAALDFDTTPSFTLTIQATDNGTPNLSGTGTVIVNLTDANSPPVPSGGPFSIAENSPNGTSVGTVSANDPDAGQTHTFSITNGNTGGAFTIDPATGQITVANSAALNFEVMPSFSLTVEVTDSGSLTASTVVTVNLLNMPEAPVAADEGTPANPYVETVGNTLLEVTASPSSSPVKVVFNGNFLTNDVDPDGPTTFTVTLESKTAGAVVTLNPNGTFTYVPPPGFVGVDSFTYRITAPDDQFDTATVYINVEHRVWYVRNDAEADGLGRSTDPFDTLTEAESASQAGDTIYLFAGNGTTTGQSDGIVLKSGQRLIGEAVQLTVPATVNINGVDGLTLRSTTGNKPKIENDNAPDTPGEDNGVSVPAMAGSVADVEIRGLEISGFDNAIDVTATGANNASVTIRDNIISGANSEGIDVTAASTGTVTLAIHDNTLTTTGAAIDVQRTAGTVYITAFDDNAVSGNTAGTGINILGAIFDAVPGSSFDTVSGGVTVIGAPGNGVGQSGLVLTSVQGRLTFADLDVFADGGAGLRASSTTAFTGSAGLQLVVSNPGVAILEATGGPVVDISQASISLPLSSIKSTNSSTTGLALNSVTGLFSAEATSSISNIASPSGTAFQVGSSNATVEYKGTINTTQGTGVSLTSNTGSTIGFSGVLTLSTGSNPAFTATGGGTVTAINTSSMLATTTATALNVASTTIGAGGLKFQSISAGTAASGPTNGIVLNSTGSSGGLTVSGSGTAGSGGTIQRAATGISLTSTRDVSLAYMQLNDLADFGIRGASVVNFSMSNTVINGTNGNDAGADEGSVRFTELTGSATISSSNISGAAEDNVAVVNTAGTLNRFTLSNTTIGANSTATGGDGLFVEAQGSAVINATVQNSFFTSSRGDLAQFTQGSTGSMDVVIQGTAFSDNHPAIVSGGGGVIVGGTNGSMTFNINSNTFRDSTGTALAVSCGNAGQSCAGRIENNQVGLAGMANSGSTGGSGIAVVSSGGGTVTALVDNNQVRQYNNHGILLQAGQTLGNATNFNVTVTNNTVSNPGTLNTNFNGIHLNNGTVPGENFTSCVDIRSNSIAGAGAGSVAPNNADYRLRQRQSTTVRLPGYSGANNDDTAVVSFVSGNQTSATTGASSNTVGSGGGGFVGGAGCALP